MDPGEQTTGTRDEQYNLISVLYHALHGAENCETYALDAEAAGDERLAAFFREAQATQRRLAERAKGMLGILEVPPEPEVAPDIPPEGGIDPGAMSGGIPPRSADVQREPDVRADEVSVPIEEVPPTTDVPRTAPDVASLEREVPQGTLPQAPPEDVQRETGGAPPQGETPSEPGRATPERRAAGQAEGEQEEKSLIDRAKDALTGRERSNRQG